MGSRSLGTWAKLRHVACRAMYMLHSLNRSLFSCVIMHDFVNYASEQLDWDKIGKNLSQTAAILGRARVKLGRR